MLLHTRRTLVTLLLCTAACSPPAGDARAPADTGSRGAASPAPAITVQELTAMYREMNTAIARGDTAALARLWAPGYTYTNVQRDSIFVLTRAERLSGLARPATVDSAPRPTDLVLDSSVVRDCEFRIYATFAAGPCGVVQYRHRGAERVTNAVVATAVFAPGMDGRWQILATHTAPLAMPQ